MEWGDIIRRVREQKSLTQQNLADELGVDKTTIIRWEQDSNIKTPQLEKLAKAELYAYHSNPSILEEPYNYYKKTRKSVSIVVDLDGSIDTLNEWFATLKKMNSALAS